MADQLMQLMRLFNDDHEEEPQPRQPRRRNRNGARTVARRHDGTPHMEGLINNNGYVQGNGNGSIILGGFDSSTSNFN
ncbi:unnamed protein product [Trifolium pratense]|uniref:Uncharacterized protein n=1 Tax=Trifolium pratense TaxID=57577 RepID=A0ACB0KZA8_TRIPR|nr:unnamed protein product [Trifolium pratense]